MKIKKLFSYGTSTDAILLVFVKFVTMALGLVITRLLSEFLTIYDYGTYSQVMLIISTVSSFSILGMMDGINFFYCGEQDLHKREAYVATIFTFQCIVGTISGCIVLALSAPICSYFENGDIKRLLIFAAVLPVLQNVLCLFQILLVSVGKARVLAIRNFVVSLVRLIAVVVIVSIVHDVAIIFAATLLLDIVQILFFWLILNKHSCYVHFSKTDFRLIGPILRYCIPMAVFTTVNALNRDIDKYLITLMTDTETLAVYSNASKPLPFDIIMASFCTVLIPSITKLVSERLLKKATQLYNLFLEISYITTGILCCAALTVSPQLINLLYSEKYLAGITVFSIYIIVDLLRFTNITLVLSAAGKTKTIMFLGLSALVCNTILNFVLYQILGISGPALATLISTALMGAFMLKLSAKELNSKLEIIFDIKYMLLFIVENTVLIFALREFQRWLVSNNMNYFIVLITVCGIYGGVMLCLNGKRLFNNFRKVNELTKCSKRGEF